MNRLSNDLKIPLFTVIFLFLGLFLYTKLAGPIPFFVNSIQTAKNDLFTVSGEGEAAAVPDMASVSIGITQQAQTVEAARDRANTVMNTVVEQLKNLGIEEKDIKTTNYNVNPNYDFRGETQTINGYTVTQNIQVKVSEIEKANQVVAIATREGANLVGGISFVLSDEKRLEAEEAARKEAIQKAKEKAESLSNLAGINLGRVIDVQEISDDQEPLPQVMELREVGGGEDTATELQPGENTIRLTIHLTYETR